MANDDIITIDGAQIRKRQTYGGRKMTDEEKKLLPDALADKLISDLEKTSKSEIFKDIKATSGENLEYMVEFIKKAVVEQRKIIQDNPALDKIELETFDFIASVAKDQIAKDVFATAISEVYQDIYMETGELQDEAGWGMEVEASWFSVEGGEHSKPSADLQNQLNEGLSTEVKLTGGAKLLLGGQITFTGFSADKFWQKSDKGGIEVKRYIEPEQINNPDFRMTVILYKMIKKMMNMLYFYIDMLDKSGKSLKIHLTALILYTTLWIEKLMTFVMNSVNVLFETGPSEKLKEAGTGPDGNMKWKHEILVKISQKKGDFRGTVGKLRELYKRELFLVMGGEAVGSDKNVRTAFSIIRKAREAYSVDNSLV